MGAVAPANDATALDSQVRALYKKAVKELTVEDLRLMIGQGVGLEYLIPLATDLLSENPFVEGDYYPGDLLSAVMNVKDDFWVSHQNLYWIISEIVAGLPPVMRELIDLIARFEAIEKIPQSEDSGDT